MEFCYILHYLSLEALPLSSSVCGIFGSRSSTLSSLQKKLITHNHVKWSSFTLKYKSNKQNKIANALSRSALLLIFMKNEVAGFEEIKRLYNNNPSKRWRICKTHCGDLLPPFLNMTTISSKGFHCASPSLYRASKFQESCMEGSLEDASIAIKPYL